MILLLLLVLRCISGKVWVGKNPKTGAPERKYVFFCDKFASQTSIIADTLEISGTFLKTRYFSLISGLSKKYMADFTEGLKM